MRCFGYVGLLALVTAAWACDKGEEPSGQSPPATQAKTTDAPKGETTTAEPAKQETKLEPLTKEQCEKICRKQNIECAIKGAPPVKDPEGMIKMCADACVMATGSPDMQSAAYVSHAQHACVDKADCDEYKKCRDEKERELKPK
jgi:hypothetical protein